MASISSRFKFFFYISSILFMDFPNSREREIFMDKNDFTRIYPILGSRGWRSRIPVQTFKQVSVPRINTRMEYTRIIEIDKAKTMSMFIYGFLHLRSKCTFVYLYLSPRYNTLSYLTSYRTCCYFSYKTKKFFLFKNSSFELF